MVDPIEIPDATREPDEYVKALLHTLGTRDPIEVYAQTPAIVRRLCEPLDAGAWTRAPADDEWNAVQVVGHLLDVDIVFGFRWRLALTEDEPAYPGYDEKAWSQLARPEPGRLLAAFDGLRAANLALLCTVRDGDWERAAVHDEQGRESVRRMVDKIGGHDLAHLNQLERTVAAAR